MATIRRRGPAWEVDVRRDGKRLRRSFGTRDGAESWLASLTGVPRAQRPYTIADVLASYIEAASRGEHGRAPIRPETIRTYGECERQLAEHLGPVRASPLGDHDLALYRAHRTAGRATRVTASKELRLLRSALTWAARRGHIEGGVTALDGLRGLTSTHRDRPAQTVSDAAVEALLDAATEMRRPDLRALLALGRWGGLRRSEALTLRLCDVDLAAGEVRIVAKPLDSGHTWRPKTGQRRAVPLRQRLAAELEVYLRWRRRVLDCPTPARAWLFLTRAAAGTPTGQRLTDVAESLRNVYRVAEVDRPARPLHALRASFATELLQAGTSPALVAQAGGWSGIAVVEQSYAGDLSGAVASLFKKLDDGPSESRALAAMIGAASQF